MRRFRTLEESLAAGEALLEFPNLTILRMDVTILAKAIDLIRGYQLLPLDAIRAATALSKGIDKLYSEDPDFDRVRGLKRYWRSE